MDNTDECRSELCEENLNFTDIPTYQGLDSVDAGYESLDVDMEVSVGSDDKFYNSVHKKTDLDFETDCTSALEDVIGFRSLHSKEDMINGGCVTDILNVTLRCTCKLADACECHGLNNRQIGTHGSSRKPMSNAESSKPSFDVVENHEAHNISGRSADFKNIKEHQKVSDFIDVRSTLHYTHTAAWPPFHCTTPTFDTNSLPKITDNLKNKQLVIVQINSYKHYIGKNDLRYRPLNIILDHIAAFLFVFSQT